MANYFNHQPRKGKTLGLIVGFISAACFIALALIVATDKDAQIIQVIDNFKIFYQRLYEDLQLSDKIAQFVSKYAKTTPTLIITTTLLLITSKTNQRVFIYLSVVLGNLCVYITKLLVQRPRPGELEQLLDSFPSGHTYNFTILTIVVMSLLIQKIQNKAVNSTLILLTLIVWLITSFSRVVVEAHHVSDTLGSLFLAVFWSYLSFQISNKFKQRSFLDG